MHAKGVKIFFGLDHDVDEMGHRRALIAADISHAGLQQRLGDGEDALAVEDLPVSQAQQLDLALEGFFHCLPPAGPGQDANSPGQTSLQYFSMRLKETG